MLVGQIPEEEGVWCVWGGGFSKVMKNFMELGYFRTKSSFCICGINTGKAEGVGR